MLSRPFISELLLVVKHPHLWGFHGTNSGDCAEKTFYLKTVYGYHRHGETKTGHLANASKNGYLRTVKFLVETGANIHTENDRALRLASSNNHLDVVKYLVESGADIHALNDCALRSASIDGHLDVVKCLVESGADIHANDGDSLGLASEYGHLGVVKFLVGKGAHAQGVTKRRCVRLEGGT